MTSRDPESLVRASVRLGEETARLEDVIAALREALARLGPETQSVVDVHWVGGLVHDFYTGLERAFAEISPAINGRPLQPDAWHRDLLHAMTLDLPGIRPPVLRAALEPPLLELLKFRHLYRNLYSFDLRWPRVRELAQDVLRLWPDVRADLTAFAAALRTLAGT